MKPLPLLLAAVWACLPALHAGDDTGNAQRKTAPPIKQALVDFNHPPREFVTRPVGGWEVFIEKQLLDEEPELARTSLARLEKKLGELTAVLPPAALPDLQRLKLFLLDGPQARAGGRDNGLEYFQATAAEHEPWLDPRMSPGMVIYNAANYVELSDFWAVKALAHEFGHAQHLEHWPEDKAEIYEAWEHAMKAGLYKTVREEDKGTFLPNYAGQNHLEYFAELTATYFVGNNYFPKNRADFKAYDPEGYALIEKYWGINGPIPGSVRQVISE